MKTALSAIRACRRSAGRLATAPPRRPTARSASPCTRSAPPISPPRSPPPSTRPRRPAARSRTVRRPERHGQADRRRRGHGRQGRQPSDPQSARSRGPGRRRQCRHRGRRQGRGDGFQHQHQGERHHPGALVQRPERLSWSASGSPRRCRASRSRSSFSPARRATRSVVTAASACSGPGRRPARQRGQGQLRGSRPGLGRLGAGRRPEGRRRPAAGASRRQCRARRERLDGARRDQGARRPPARRTCWCSPPPTARRKRSP